VLIEELQGLQARRPRLAEQLWGVGGIVGGVLVVVVVVVGYSSPC
jgi:hypothetical protein